MAELFETLLPSGRGIRVEKLNTKDYRAAMRRAGDRSAKVQTMSQFNFQQDILHELLLSSLRALTPVMVDLVKDKKKQPDGTEVEEFNLDATLEKVPAAAWQPVTYESLITEGPTSLYQVLGDPRDYEHATVLVSQVTNPTSPLAQMVAGKKRLISTT